MFQLSLTHLVFPSRIFLLGRRCSDVRAAAISTLSVFLIIKLSRPPRRHPCGISDWDTLEIQSPLKFCKPFFFSVIKLMLTHALLAGWARMFVYLLLNLLHRHFSPFNLFIQMFGHHLFLVILVINMTLSFLMITRITYGQFHFAINLMFSLPLERLFLTFILNFAYPS